MVAHDGAWCKTAVGSRLATKLGVPFVDSDHEIEAAGQLTVPESLNATGSLLRKRETEVISRLLDKSHRDSCHRGGALSGQEANRDKHLGGVGLSVWLRC